MWYLCRHQFSTYQVLCYSILNVHLIPIQNLNAYHRWSYSSNFKHQTLNSTLKGENSPILNVSSQIPSYKSQISNAKFRNLFSGKPSNSKSRSPLLKNSLTPISRYLLLLRNSAQSSVIATRIPQTIHRQARSYVIEISGRSSCSLKSYMNQRWRTTSWYIRRRLLRSQTRAARAVSLRWQPSWICGAVR